MKKASIIFVALMVCSAMNAIIVQHIQLKNGTVLNGYIEKQDTKGNYTIRTENAIVCLVNSRYATKEDTLRGAKFFKDITINKVSYAEIDVPQVWKEWADKNDAYSIDEGGKRSLILNEVSIDGQSIGLTKVLENGAKVKYIEMKPNSYSVEWKNIESIKGDMRQRQDLSGINRVYQTSNGRTFEGQFAEETDKTLSLYIDGTIESFDINDVVKYSFKGINKDQSLIQQTPLLDIVRGKNGSECRGVIIEQNYTSKKNSENYILVQDENGSHQSIKLSDLAEIRRETNSQYTPLYDIILKEGEVQVNDSTVKKISIIEKNDKLYADSIADSTVIQRVGNEICVAYRIKDYSDAEAFQLVKINEESVKKSKKVTSPSYYITYKDLASSESHPTNIEKTPNCVKATYRVHTPGIYALYDSRKKEAFILKIE